MPKKIDDDTLADAPEAFTKPDEPTLTPEKFNLAAWLEGMSVAKAKYELAGLTLDLTARTPTWRTEYVERVEDMEPFDQNMEFIVGHIESPEGITRDALKTIQETHWAEIDELLVLCKNLDERPRNQIAPRFLRTASD